MRDTLIKPEDTYSNFPVTKTEVFVMGIWHEEIDGWVLTYSKKRDGRKEVLSATNPEIGLYLSAGEPVGLQKSLETLYRSRYPEESELPERDQLEERDLTQHGLETLEENIRSEAEELLDGGEGSEDRRYTDEEIAELKQARYDHETDL